MTRPKDALPQRLLPVEVHPDMFAFMVELDVTDWGDGAPLRRDYTTVEQIRAEAPTNGTRVWTWFDKAKLERAVAGGRFVIVDLWLASVQTMRDAQTDGAADYQAYLDERVGWIRELQRKWGNRVWFCICGEQDNGIQWPETPFASKREGYEYFEKAHLTDFNCYGPPAKGFEPHNVRKMADVPMMRARYGITDFRKEPIAIQIAMCVAAHPAYAWGAGLVWMERNCWLANNQIGIAFMRGAARQYRALWGLDFSSWGDPTNCTCHFKEDGTRAGGMSESLLLREWIAAFYSGANSLLAESSASCAWMPDGRGGLKLSPYGENCREFGRHTLLKHSDRGRPLVPMALMLEKYHGWDPRDHRIWGGAFPYGPGEQMLDNFFNLVFPGHERGFYHDEWRKPGQPPQLPYVHAIPDARKAMAEGLDTRPLEKGMLAPSTWGDAFDVVLEDCPLDVLQEYPLLMLLGAIKLTPALRDKLDAYVRGGGTAIVNVMQSGAEDDPWFGVACRRDLRRIRYTFTCLASGKSYDTGFGVYHPMTIVGPDTAPLITVIGKPDEPAAACRTLGKGRLIFISFPWLQTKPDWPITPSCADLLDGLIRAQMPVDVQGETPIEFLVNRRDDGVIVTLVNNAATTWNGRVVRLAPDLAGAKVRELWRDRELPATDGNERELVVTVAPFDFKILEIKRRT